MKVERVLIAVLLAFTGFVGYQVAMSRSRRPALAAEPGGGTPNVAAANGAELIVDSASLGSSEPPGDTAEMRKIIDAGRYGTYIDDILRQNRQMVLRWPDRTSRPLKVWVQPVADLPNWRPENPGIAQNAFVEWSDLGIPVKFTFVSDSAAADVPVVWVGRMGAEGRIGDAGRIGVTRVTSDGRWIVGAQITVATHSVSGEPLAREIIRACVVHEVGHLLGLAHTADQTSIMTSSAMPNKQSVAATDRATVRLLYSLAGGSLNPKFGSPSR
jgi:hypothetical protein